MTPRETIAYVEDRLATQGSLGIVRARLDGNAEAGNLELRLETSLHSVLCSQGTDIDHMQVDCLLEAAADVLSAAAAALRGEKG